MFYTTHLATKTETNSTTFWEKPFLFRTHLNLSGLGLRSSELIIVNIPRRDLNVSKEKSSV